jgi:hypothetical protein
VFELIARVASPVVLFTFCLLEVTLCMYGLSASSMTGVPYPDGKEIASSGELFL